ncbi:transposase [Streptomyces sp. NPDC048419]|uniref:transposase n=1 Tax=Streptomyces sp. NPDC048419 TaxID=3365547 RepID=UPI00371CA714
MLEIVGIGPDSAAALLIAAGDHPDRIANEAFFAALCGLSPAEQSSGRPTAGDRRLQFCLERHHRRRTESKTDREIRRYLKRYLARRPYRHLKAPLRRTWVDGTWNLHRGI